MSPITRQLCRILVTAAIGGCAGGAWAAPQTPNVENPFAGFETHYLSNGLRVWYRHIPEAREVSLWVSLPYGSDRDPPGKEQLAHFTEHMLFSDHLGKTEEIIKREIEDRGGRRNGVTSADQTYYYVHIDKRHGMFALEWLQRIVSPHEMAPEVVERGREPIALELGIRPRELTDYFRAYYLDPLPLRLPGFWKSEFGVSSRRDRAYDPLASLHSITPQDLRSFYDTYYVPSRMTLVIVGDLERDAVLEQAEATFGTLAPRPDPGPFPPTTTPGRYRQQIFWDFRANVYYDTRFKIYDMSAEDHLNLLFVQHLLQIRLNRRLRFGERKAVYGIGVWSTSRGKATYLMIETRIKGELFDFARSVIEEELEMLREGSHPPEEFETDREAIVIRLERENRQPPELASWAVREFYDPDIHRDFPDVANHFRGLSLEALGKFARARLIRDNRYHWLIRRQPLSQAMFLLAASAIGFTVLRLSRRFLTRPVEMRRLRYVARFRRPLFFRIGVIPAAVLVVALLYRLAFFGLQQLVVALVLPIDSYVVQYSFYALVASAGVFTLVLVAGMLPAKILVFDDHLRIKYRTYRSRVISREDVESIAVKRLADLRKSGSLPRTIPLSLGLFRPAVHLALRRGTGYLFRVRDNDELVEVVSGILERGGASPIGASAAFGCSRGRTRPTAGQAEGEHEETTGDLL